MIYLQKISQDSKLLITLKITDKGILINYGYVLEIEKFQLVTIEAEEKYYIDTLKYRESTKEIFDKQFIETVEKINELSKL